MAWATSLSTNTPTESSGYRVPAEPDLSWVSESGDSQPANESWHQVGGQQIRGQQLGGPQIGGQMINLMFHADRAPHRHVEAYQ